MKICSESGFGRYDVMMIPVDRKSKLPAIVIEFKVYNKSREKTLEDSVNNALKQIKEKNYAMKFIKENKERKILAAAICYRSDTKEHECKVEDIN